MPKLSIICAAAVLTAPALVVAQTPVAPQVEQSRQFIRPPSVVDLQGQRNAPPAGDFEGAATTDNAFGEQAIFKRLEKPQPFSGFAEVGAFVTNNVALTRNDPRGDGFLVATVGASFIHRFAYNLRFDAGVVGSAYRYDRFPQLNFQSTDLSVGVTWSPPQMRGAEAVVRYTYTDLTTPEHVREFYKNQAILLGIQKVVPFSRAQGIYFGANAQWSFADPKPDGRDEYTVYAGYRAQLTRHISVDFFYRYGRYVYRFGDGRHDNNQTVSLGLCYSPKDWLSLSLTGYLAADRSNQPAFDYNVANLGVGMQLSIRF